MSVDHTHADLVAFVRAAHGQVTNRMSLELCDALDAEATHLDQCRERLVTAEAERERMLADPVSWREETWKMRAEQAEAELAAARATLDALVKERDNLEAAFNASCRETDRFEVKARAAEAELTRLSDASDGRRLDSLAETRDQSLRRDS